MDVLPSCAVLTVSCAGVVNDEEYVYYGSFAGGLRDGEGVTEWADGKHHEGMYRGGQRNGMGRFTWPNGHCYVGEFKVSYLVQFFPSSLFPFLFCIERLCLPCSMLSFSFFGSLFPCSSSL